MKKFTLLATAALALTSFTANAELMDKYFFKVSTETAEGWTLQDAGRMTLTPGKDCLGVTLTNSGGRMINGFWNEDAWKKVTDLSTLPDNTYSFTKDMKMVSNTTRSDMEFVLLPVGACASSDSRVSSHNYHWFNAQDAEGAAEDVTKEDFFFRYRVVASTAEEVKILINEQPNARTNWVAVTETSDTCFLKVGVKYTFRVDVNVSTKTAAYTITDGAEFTKTGSHTYVCAEDRAGIWVMSANSGGSKIELSNIGLCYKKEGPFATEPRAELFWVEGEERDYMVTFAEGEVLHWVQLGDVEEVVGGNSREDGQEYTVTYNDAIDSKQFEEGEDKGRKIITCVKSGSLKMWTTREDDETNISDEVLVDVVCEKVGFPTPTAVITNVSEGYGKEYTISVDNSGVVLKPVITIHYEMNDGTKGDILSGEKITFTGAGKVSLYCWDKTHKVECYDRSETIEIENNVEYTVALDTSYVKDYETICAGLEGFHVVETIDDQGKSHWDRIMSSEKRGYKEDGNNEVYNADNADSYTWVKEGHNIFPDTYCGKKDGTAKWNILCADNVRNAALPLYPSEEDVTIYKEDAWSIFPYEGVVYYDVNSTAAVKKNDAGAAGYVEMKIIDNYVSDDATKPNFFIVNKVGGYNRPDKGDCTSSEVIECGKTFWLYRYDTAIRSVRVMTYKGFEVGIETISAKKQNASEAIYNLSGIRVNRATSGLYVKGGKVILVK